MKTTAQDAPGSTIAAWDDLQVGVFFDARDHARTGARGRCRTRGRPERAHRSLENRGRFPTSAHRHHRVLDQRKERTRQASDTARDWPATITEFRSGRLRRSFC